MVGCVEIAAEGSMRPLPFCPRVDTEDFRVV